MIGIRLPKIWGYLVVAVAVLRLPRSITACELLIFVGNSSYGRRNAQCYVNVSLEDR